MNGLYQKDDHPGYSCERAPWALVTVSPGWDLLRMSR